MTFELTRNTFITISIIHLLNHIAYGEINVPPPTIATTATTTTTATASTMRKQTNRFLTPFFRKYGSRGTISFEGLEHLMHNLDIGGLEFPAKHTLDQHRPTGYKPNDIDNDEESTTYENFHSADVMTADIETTTSSATTYTAEDDYLIKLLKTMNNEQQADVFRTMHDPNHRHPRHREHKTCLSPISLIQLFHPEAYNNSFKQNPMYRSSLATEHDHHHSGHGDEDADDLSVSNIQITPSVFMHMCPALLLQIEQGSCAEPMEVRAQHEGGITLDSWIMAVVSVTIISLCGLVGVGMVPLTRFKVYHEILRFMIAIAIGTLCGDALMHLLPHALMPHDDHHSETRHSHSHEEPANAHGHNGHNEAVWLCGCAFVAALIMYAIESLLPLISGGGHGHSHAPHPPKKQQPTELNPNQQTDSIDRSNYGSCEDLDNDIENSKKNNEENVMVQDTKNVVRPALTPVAFMVVIGDGLHNLTDGMAIGAAFGVDPVTGMATAFAVLCHELPHELGDFALLLQTGVSLRRAILLNIVSSILSFVGMVIGLLIVNVNSAFVRWIYAGTAGTFLYIAFADLVPELNRTELTVKMVFIHICGFLSGGIIMLFIALYEDDLKSLFE